MTNLLIPFEYPICGSDGFRQVEVNLLELTGEGFKLRDYLQ